jgi:hypothetical protein
MGSDRFMEEQRRAPDRVGEADALLRRILRMRDLAKVKEAVRALMNKWNQEDE